MRFSAFKRTKIVATIGPSSKAPHVIEDMILSGANGFRLNMSHVKSDEYNEYAAMVKHIRALTKKHRKAIAIIADIQGPRIRVGLLPNEGLPFIRGNTVRFEVDANYEKTGHIPVQHNIAPYVKPGERIFLKDGQITVEVEKVQRKVIAGKVLSPGVLYSNQGINLPDTDLAGEILTEKDLSDLHFAARNDCDYIALSFVQDAQDVRGLRRRLEEMRSDMKIIAKIETAAAVKNLNEVMEASDAVMVARGDLAIETKPEAVPGTQRRIVELASQYRRPVIIATQMLESMIQSQQPTRAEVSDVATAVIEGADAVMLSGETAMGLFPVDSVKMMQRIIHYTETEVIQPGKMTFSNLQLMPTGNAIAAAAAVMARQLPAKLIVAGTSSGRTARNIAAQRPDVTIVAITDSPRIHHQMSIVWGVKSYIVERMHGASDLIIRDLKALGNVGKGDYVVEVSGNRPGLVGGTDRLVIKVVE